MLSDVINSILVILIGAALKLVFVALGVEIEPALFNTLVAAIVLWILRRLGMGIVESIMPKTVYRLKERNLWRSE